MRFVLTFLFCWMHAYALDVEVYDFEFKDMDLHKAIESVAALDNRNVVFSSSVSKNKISLTLNHVTPAFALRIILENYGYVAVEKGDVLHIMTQVERGPASTPTVIIPLANVVAKDIEPNLKTFLGSAGALSVNELQNALIVAAPADITRELRQLVEELDKASNQVYIEAKIIETSTQFAQALGIQWGVVNNGSTVLELKAPAADTSIATSFVTGLTGSAKLDAAIEAGERNGQLKVISSPKVTTLNGTAANIQSLTTFNVRTLAASQTTTGQAQQVGGLEQIQAGVQLQVTPYIVSQEQVRLKIDLTKSEPDFSRVVDGIPGVSDNTARTSLVVRSGQTASIGGLIYQTRSENTVGAPWLSSVPVLGYLFGSSEKKREDKELMIFITPTVFRAEKSAANAPPGRTVSMQGEDPRKIVEINTGPGSNWQFRKASVVPAKKIVMDGSPEKRAADQKQLDASFENLKRPLPTNSTEKAQGSSPLDDNGRKFDEQLDKAVADAP